MSRPSLARHAVAPIANRSIISAEAKCNQFRRSSVCQARPGGRRRGRLCRPNRD
jgi:hypothetical protein